ncbi:hypothetical protein GCK72_021471 [Caenorhabditis remanei]|uniref:Uncharacterized protein n=1 Tax=Caenorhabditis remanei TaxID=31234 RepID=A0A6A5GJX8_CAERE|nr:hypothetical protein GCK72_021471 [Caenorhabditis remanei]KAF1754906.1 hypothetical protein GCK72_021471 [Caenorhabditis remanei]
MLLAVFLLISLCMKFSTPKTLLDVYVTGKDDPKCGKYMQNHLKPVLRIKYVRLLRANFTEDNNGLSDSILSNTLCTPKTNNGYNSSLAKYEFDCKTIGQESTEMPNWFIFAVGTDQQMMSSQIEYRYNHDAMGMFQYLKPEEVMAQQFTHASHLHIRYLNMTFNNKPSVVIDYNCLDTYPDSLIADHGLYIRKSNETMHTRLYFDPDSVGEKFPRPVLI